MDTVTEAPMVVSIATLGGIDILHSNATLACQASLVCAVKSRRFPSLADPVHVAPDAVATDYPGAGCVLVTTNGDPGSKLLGVPPVSEWGRQGRPASACLYHTYAVMPESSDFEAVAVAMAEFQDFMPLVANGDDGSKVVGVIRC